MRNFKKINGFVVLVVLLINVMSFSALAKEDHKDLMKYVKTTIECNVITKHIDTSNLEKLKSGNSEKEVLELLGYTNQEIKTLKDDKLLFENIMETTITEKYVRVTADGKMEIMRKEDCLEKARASKQKQLNDYLTDNNDGTNTETSDDGYMKIVTRSDYINPSYVDDQKGWYNFVGTFTWLDIPEYRMIDAMSLYANNVAWSESNNYSRMEYTFSVYNNGFWIRCEDFSEVNDVTDVKPDGMYFKHDLPINYINIPRIETYVLSGLSHTITGRGRVTNHTLPTNLNVYTRYEHVYSAIKVQPSFGWTTEGKPGVSVNVTAVSKANTYNSYNYTSYDPNR